MKIILKNISIKLIVFYLLTILPLIYSFKFLLFAVIPKYFQLLVLLKNYPNLSRPEEKNFILEYAEILFELKKYDMSLTLIFLIFTVFVFIKKRPIELVITSVSILSIQMSGILSFSNLKFYAIIPGRIWENNFSLKYLLTNWIIYLGISILIYLKFTNLIIKKLPSKAIK